MGASSRGYNTGLNDIISRPMIELGGVGELKQIEKCSGR